MQQLQLPGTWWNEERRCCSFAAKFGQSRLLDGRSLAADTGHAPQRSTNQSQVPGTGLNVDVTGSHRGRCARRLPQQRRVLKRCTICTQISMTISGKYQTSDLLCFCAPRESTADFTFFNPPGWRRPNPHQARVQFLQHGMKAEKRSDWPKWTVPPRSAADFGNVHANLAFTLYEMLCASGHFGHGLAAQERSRGHGRGTPGCSPQRTEAEQHC